MLDYLRENDEPVEFKGKCADFAITFRNLFTDCLILADYMQPHEFLVEALLIHLYAEYVATRDAKSSLWVLVGLIARLAMRMGYHQATPPFQGLTIFQVSRPTSSITLVDESRPRCVVESGPSSDNLIF
jgi:hypothetical protein